MSPPFHAILAYSRFAALLALLVIMQQSPVISAPPPSPPHSENDAKYAIPVTFTRTDGIRHSGTLTGWNESSFTGTFGRHEWLELTYRDCWRILNRLIDRDIPDDWLLAARILLDISLDQPDAAEWAERAIRHARRVAGENETEAIEQRIKAIRDEHDAKKHAQAERKHDLDPSQLRTRTPEADDWPSAPWPKLSRNEQRNAVLTVKNDAKQALAAIDLEIEPIETANVLIYTDLDRNVAIRLAIELDGIFHETASILQQNPRDNPFWGKAALIILTDRDAYDRLQTDAFGYMAAFDGEKAGISGAVPAEVHPIGPKVFITLHQADPSRQDAFRLALTRMLVRGILHRYITPRRLPPWANDGIGMVVADRLYYDDSLIIKRRRGTELIYLRELTDDADAAHLRMLIDMRYGDDQWPAWEWRLAALGGLFVELMAREKPREFVKWVEAVKRGADWREALEETYGVTLDALLDTATRYYRTND